MFVLFYPMQQFTRLSDCYEGAWRLSPCLTEEQLIFFAVFFICMFDVLTIYKSFYPFFNEAKMGKSVDINFFYISPQISLLIIWNSVSDIFGHFLLFQSMSVRQVLCQCGPRSPCSQSNEKNEGTFGQDLPWMIKSQMHPHWVCSHLDHSVQVVIQVWRGPLLRLALVHGVKFSIKILKITKSGILRNHWHIAAEPSCAVA